MYGGYRIKYQPREILLPLFLHPPPPPHLSSPTQQIWSQSEYTIHYTVVDFVQCTVNVLLPVDIWGRRRTVINIHYNFNDNKVRGTIKNKYE